MKVLRNLGQCVNGFLNKIGKVTDFIISIFLINLNFVSLNEYKKYLGVSILFLVKIYLVIVQPICLH